MWSGECCAGREREREWRWGGGSLLATANLPSGSYRPRRVPCTPGRYLGSCMGGCTTTHLPLLRGASRGQHDSPSRSSLPGMFWGFGQIRHSKTREVTCRRRARLPKEGSARLRGDGGSWGSTRQGDCSLRAKHFEGITYQVLVVNRQHRR